MRPRIVTHLGVADVVTVANAVIGLLAVVTATYDPDLAARLILLAAMGDGLDGILARRYGGTPLGEHLDSLADVAAFGIAPAILLYTVTTTGWAITPDPRTIPALLLLVIPALYLAMAVVRLAFYTAHNTHVGYTEGAPTTLAATILAAAVLTHAIPAGVLLAGTFLLTYLMVVSLAYPDLLIRDTVVMGTVQGLAVLIPSMFGRVFPIALVSFAVAYLLLAPRFYWAAPDPDPDPDQDADPSRARTPSGRK